MTKWNEQFDAFVARKQAAALSAGLSGYLTVGTESPPPGLETVGSPWTRQLFDGPFFESPAPGVLPSINTVFVQSADRNTGARNPVQLGGGPTDTHLIYEGLSRVRADAVMTGASTIRGSQMLLGVWHPELVQLRERLGLPQHPAQIVATRSGRLEIDSELMFNVPDVAVFILTTPGGAATLAPRLRGRSWISIVVAPDETRLADSLARLRADHGIRRISCIGGRTLATALIDAGVVQDLYMTTSPRPGGEPGTPFYTGPVPPVMRRVVKKAGLGDETGVVFEHLLLP